MIEMNSSSTWSGERLMLTPGARRIEIPSLSISSPIVRPRLYINVRSNEQHVQHSLGNNIAVVDVSSLLCGSRCSSSLLIPFGPSIINMLGILRRGIETVCQHEPPAQSLAFSSIVFIILLLILKAFNFCFFLNLFQYL